MFFKKDSTKTENNFLVKTCALLIYAAKIDEKYTEKEEEIIKKTLIELGAKKETLAQTIKDKDNEEVMDLVSATFSKFELNEYVVDKNEISAGLSLEFKNEENSLLQCGSRSNIKFTT